PECDRLAFFSNFSRTRHNSGQVISPGAAIDVAAPGVNVISTWTNSLYAWPLSGTSFSAPYVSGLVAVYISIHGRATNAAGVYAIRQAIVDAALPQSAWQSADPQDPDTNHEGLAMPS